MKKVLLATTVSAVAMLTAAPSYADLTANVSVTNNYIWRGLTQTINEAAVQGGIDYASDSGFYAGTWVSNVSYDSDDAYSYEHDMYFGFAGETETFSYDIGYLYYNYDSNAGYDFSEVYGSLGFGNLSVGLSLLAHAEPSAGPGEDFGFGKASYWSLDYTIPLPSGVEIGLHAGYHKGDFMYSFNGAAKNYMDYNVSLAKDGFSFMITGTNLGSDDDNDGFVDYASMPARSNDKIKFVVAYGVDFQL